MSSTIIPFGLGGSGGGGLNFFSFGTEDWDQPHDYTTFYGTDGWNLIHMLASDNTSDSFRRYYNANTRIGDAVRDCSGMFGSTYYISSTRFNSTVIIPSANGTGRSCGGMFNGCSSFNAPVIIEKNSFSGMSCYNMFFGCNSFNQPIDFANIYGDINGSYMFYMASSFNQPVDFTNITISNAYSMFENSGFNQPINLDEVNIPSNAYTVFANSKFNQPLNIKDSHLANLRRNWFIGCRNLRANVNFVNSSSWALSGTFDNVVGTMQGCWNMNLLIDAPNMADNRILKIYTTGTNYNASTGGLTGNIFLGDNVVNVRHFVYWANMFNANVYIGNGVTDCSYMFESLYGFNANVHFGSNIKNCAFMFGDCQAFNKPVVIPEGVQNCTSMFMTCSDFNENISIPNTVTSCSGMLNGCRNYSKNLFIPSSCTSISALCQRLNRTLNIFVNCEGRVGDLYTFNMFNGANNSYRKNIFCKSQGYFIKEAANNSIVGAPISWSSMVNGYYNTTYNIYIYNNYEG